MKVYIAKIDYFDPEKWPVLAVRDGGLNPYTSRTNIEDVVRKLGKGGIAILVGSSSQRVPFRLKHKLLGAVSCHTALDETKVVVDRSHYTSSHFPAQTAPTGCRTASAIHPSLPDKNHTSIRVTRAARNW